MKKKKYDWETIKTEYVTSKISLRELSKNKKISYSTLSKKAVSDKWAEERKKYWNKIGTKLEQKQASQEVNKLAKLIQCSNDFDEILELFLKRKKKSKKLTPADMNFLASAIKKAIDIKRDANGIMTPFQEEKLRIELEKLKLDKKRLSSDKTDKNVTVVFKDYDEEYSE